MAQTNVKPVTNVLLANELPAALRSEASEALAKPIMQAVIGILRNRVPPHPLPEHVPSQQIAQAFLRMGYEQCLRDLSDIPTETDAPVEAFSHILDPRD